MVENNFNDFTAHIFENLEIYTVEYCRIFT